MKRASIPRIDGDFGVKLWPIYDSKMKALGVEGPSSRQYRGTVLCDRLPPHDPWRLFFVCLVETQTFQWLTLLVIIGNCVLMALKGPQHDVSTSGQEIGFTLFFTFELAVQVMALSFVGHKHAYLSDPWNQLDGIIVAVSWLPIIFPSSDNYTGARALRALRPLRTIRRVPKLKHQVDTILDSLPYLLDVAMLAGFIVVVWGTLGLQLFKGLLRYRCYTIGESQPLDPQHGVCQPPPPSISSLRGSCSAGQECRFFDQNPVWGLIGFDVTNAEAQTLNEPLTLLFHMFAPLLLRVLRPTSTA